MQVICYILHSIYLHPYRLILHLHSIFVSSTLHTLRYLKLFRKFCWEPVIYTYQSEIQLINLCIILSLIVASFEITWIVVNEHLFACMPMSHHMKHIWCTQKMSITAQQVNCLFNSYFNKEKYQSRALMVLLKGKSFMTDGSPPQMVTHVPVMSVTNDAYYWHEYRQFSNIRRT